MAEHKYLTAPDPNQTGWPGGIKYIIGNEGCERFSYYGMRAILFLYIVSLFANFREFDKEDYSKALESRAIVEAAITKVATDFAEQEAEVNAAKPADDEKDPVKLAEYKDKLRMLTEAIGEAEDKQIAAAVTAKLEGGDASEGDTKAAITRAQELRTIIKDARKEAEDQFAKQATGGNNGDEEPKTIEELIEDKIKIKATVKAATPGATHKYHLFSAAVYAFPMLGAILADRLLGKYRTILWLSIVYCIGHAFLALFENSALQMELFGTVFIDEIYGLYLGLGLIAIGSGGIKPCVSAHVGDQFGKGNWHLIQKVYNAFYFIINFGSAFATIIIPRVRGAEKAEVIFDPELGEQVVRITYEGSVTWAFAIPGILMGLATIFFYMGRKEFVHVPPTHPGQRGLLDFLSGASLFMVVGIPMFFAESFESQSLMWGLMAAAFVLFVALFTVRQNIEQDDGFLAILFYCIFQRGSAPTLNEVYDDEEPREREPHELDGHWFWEPAVRRFGGPATEGPVAVLKIMSVFVSIAVFWALFDQHGSTWIDQAKKMDRTIDFSFVQWSIIGIVLGLLVSGAFALTLSRSTTSTVVTLSVGVIAGAALGGFLTSSIPVGFEIQPSEVPALNPFMVMILIPFMTFGVYPLMKKIGIDPKPLTRMSLGMFVASLSFVSVALIQMTMDSLPTGEKLHVGWQLIPYTVITIAEVMVSITGLEFAYSQAPKRMKSVIMGFWLFMVALGNVLVAALANLPEFSPAKFFWLYAGLMGGAALLFGLRAKFYRYKDYTQ